MIEDRILTVGELREIIKDLDSEMKVIADYDSRSGGVVVNVVDIVKWNDDDVKYLTFRSEDKDDWEYLNKCDKEQGDIEQTHVWDCW